MTAHGGPIDEVADGVYAVDHAVAEGKNAVVLGARHALAVDAGTYAPEGAAMAELVRESDYDVSRFALTHGHGDHVLGSEVFAGCEVYAHALTPRVMTRQIPAWTDRWDTSAEEYRERLAWPTVTFTDELALDLGELTVRMFPTPGHSEDGVSMYIPERRALIAGDSVPTGIVPAIGDGDSRVLQRSLYRLMTMEIDVLIPGHGPVLHGVTRVREWLGWLATYLANIRSAARELVSAGVGTEEIVARIRFDEHVGDRLPADKHGMLQRHAATVEVIVAEVIQEAAGT
jgi:glyoxylase-like metal-dependent hydrolase (beta-lactamase superfamily II)